MGTLRQIRLDAWQRHRLIRGTTNFVAPATKFCVTVEKAEGSVIPFFVMLNLNDFDLEVF
jgi:hypothetical protein